MNEELLGILNGFGRRTLTVVGDCILDEYLEGHAGRMCREGPVPVVEVDRAVRVPGGAGNTAANVSAMGARVRLVSACGADGHGASLGRELAALGVGTESLLHARKRKTVVKSRVVADGQLLMRLDEGQPEPLRGRVAARLAAELKRAAEASDALIVSDYAYGVLTGAVFEALSQLDDRLPVIIDSRRLSAYRHLAPTACKPSLPEAGAQLGLSAADIDGGERVSLAEGLGDRLHELSGARIVMLTLDADGAIVFERGRQPYRTLARHVADPHPAGAGDTYLVAFTLALCSGADTPQAAEIAAAAAGVVVTRDGTSRCSIPDLRAALGAGSNIVRSLPELASEVSRHRADGHRIVLTNGCFDLLHEGHVSLLEQARSFGDVLIVGVNSDDSVRRLKGPGRPINRLAQRMEVLSALGSVSHVIAFDESTAETLVRTVEPDVYVKGGDYRSDTIPEAALVRELGGRVEILGRFGRESTSGLIERIRAVAAGSA